MMSAITELAKILNNQVADTNKKLQDVNESIGGLNTTISDSDKITQKYNKKITILTFVMTGVVVLQLVLILIQVLQPK